MDGADRAPVGAAEGAYARGRAQVAVLACAVLAVSLALTGLTAWNSHRLAHAGAREAFDQRINHLQEDIEDRLELPVRGLVGARAAWAASASGRLDRAGFYRFVDSRHLPTEFPGVRGVGFIQRVQRGDLPGFTAAERADHAPDFAVRTGGTAADLYVIKYIEPAVNNLGAMGYDVGSEPIRRQAMERAVRTGLPSLTGPITLVQASGSGPGLLYALPVYRYGTDPQSPDKREAVLVGLVYSPIVIAELLGDHGSFNSGELDYELVDSTAPGTEALLHRVGAPLDRGSRARMFQDTRSFDIGGRTWTVRAGSTPAFEAARAARVPAVIASLGAVISALLALLVWHLGTRRARAEALARRATAELALERQRLVDILEGANVGTWEMHIATGDCRFDARWAEGLGYTLAELDHATFDEHGDLAHAGLIATQVHPDDLPALHAALAAHYAGQTDHFECELRMRHKAGHWLWMLARGRVSQWDAAGQPAVIAGTRMDISDRRAAKAALADANAALEERVAKRTAQLQRAVNDLQAFGYSIAHDIRQPLISMGGFTRLLERELGADPTSRAAHYLDRLRVGVRQIGELSDGLLTLANLSTAPLDRCPVDLSVLAREVFEARRGDEPERQAVAHIADGLVAHGDAAQLRRLLAILIDNAFKFSRDKAAVEVTVSMETGDNGREVFHVSDRGTGFDMAHAGRLFEPFRRLHAQHEFDGLGIGLASAHRIVSRHNGRIWADATPGEGARFSFTLGEMNGYSSQIGH